MRSRRAARPARSSSCRRCRTEPVGPAGCVEPAAQPLDQSAIGNDDPDLQPQAARVDLHPALLATDDRVHGLHARQLRQSAERHALGAGAADRPRHRPARAAREPHAGRTPVWQPLGQCAARRTADGVRRRLVAPESLRIQARRGAVDGARLGDPGARRIVPVRGSRKTRSRRLGMDSGVDRQVALGCRVTRRVQFIRSFARRRWSASPLRGTGRRDIRRVRLR